MKIRLIKISLLGILFACSQTQKAIPEKKMDKVMASPKVTGNFNYQLQDLSGIYRLSRNIYRKNGKVYFESELLNPSKTQEVLEKSQIVLKQVNRNGRDILIPLVSQFTSWINKQKHFSQIKINTKKKVYEVYTEPENQTVEERFVGGDWICPFSLLPECLGLSKLVEQGARGKWVERDVWLMWDMHPYQQKFYENISPSMFTRAKLIFEGTKDGYYQVTAEVSEQSISLLFTPAFRFEKMIWVAQGLSLTLQ